MGPANRRLVCLMYLCVAFAGALSALTPLRDYDLWWHIRTGEWILDHHQIPRADIFSYSAAGKPWIAHEWPFDALLGLIHRTGGLLGIIYLKASLAAATVLLLAWLCRRWGGSIGLTTLTSCTVAVLISPWMNGRPQMIIPLFLVLELHILRSYLDGHRLAALWLPALFLLWVNFHGGFLIGFIPLVAFAISFLLDRGDLDLRHGLPRPQVRPLYPLLIGTALALLATLANVNGLKGALYPLEYITGSCVWHQGTIAEYQSPDFHAGYARNIELFVLLALAALIATPKPPRLADATILLLFVYLFLQWGRNGPLLVIVAAPLVAGHLTERLRASFPRITAAEERSHDPSWPVAAAVAGALVVALGVMLPRDPSLGKTMQTWSAPVQAARVVQMNGIAGNMYATYRWGGYLIYALWPEHRVYIDGRADLYGEDLFREYERASRFKPGWQDPFRRWNMQWALVESASPLVQGLEMLPNWALIYSSDDSRLFIRTDGVNAPVYRAFRNGKLRVPPPL